MNDRPKEKTIAETADPSYECRICGYIYDPKEGEPKLGVEPNTVFTDVPDSWRCPICGAGKPAFKDIGPRNVASGFEENLKYGLGVNSLTPGQKNFLIFGGLITAFLLFISLYITG